MPDNQPYVIRNSFMGIKLRLELEREGGTRSCAGSSNFAKAAGTAPSGGRVWPECQEPANEPSWASTLGERQRWEVVGRASRLEPFGQRVKFNIAPASVGGEN